MKQKREMEKTAFDTQVSLRMLKIWSVNHKSGHRLHVCGERKRGMQSIHVAGVQRRLLIIGVSTRIHRDSVTHTHTESVTH